MNYRIGIQILSFNKPHYLIKTLDSLMKVKGPRDKIIVFEQSDSDEIRKEGLAICKEHSDVQVILSQENLGQRGATNKVIESGFFNDCEFVMLTDHDNIFHEPLDIYVDKLNEKPSIWVATGYNSPEHDIENKDGEWLLKTTARAGHMVLRQADFMSLTPLDEKAGIAQGCAWFAGLDWLITHWHPKSPGMKRAEIIASYPGGVEHIGRESTWQGKYDDEYTVEENLKFRSQTLEEILTWYKPRHTYQDGKYWYEKEPPKVIVESTPNSTDDHIKKLFMDSFKKDLSDNDVELVKTFWKNATPVDIAVESELPLKSYDGEFSIIAFNYMWPNYGFSFLKQSIEAVLPYVDKYVLYLNKHSYIGNPCPHENIRAVNAMIDSIGSDKIFVDFNASEYFVDDAKNDNISYYIKKCLSDYEVASSYIWLVQSDEIYEPHMCEQIVRLAQGGAITDCAVFTPICYMDTPNWKIDPPEEFTRPTLICNRYGVDLNNKEFIHNITFNHLSYVLTRAELAIKFENWGHRGDVNLHHFKTKFESFKRNKDIGDLHPIHGPTYKRAIYDGSELARSNFRSWVDKGDINSTLSFILHNLIPLDGKIAGFTSVDIGITDINDDRISVITDNHDLYQDIDKYSEKHVKFGSLIDGLQMFNQEELNAFIHHVENVSNLKDDIINIYTRLSHCGVCCIVYPNDRHIDTMLSQILVSGQVMDSDDQRFMFNFDELDVAVMSTDDYNICLFRANLINPFSKIKSDKVIFGPFIGEFGWEVSKWAPAVNKFITDNPNTEVVVATDKDSFELYRGASNYYHVSSPPHTKDCFNNVALNDNLINHLIDDITGVFPGHELVNPTSFNAALNIFPFKDMSFKYDFNAELVNVFATMIEGNGRIPVAISCRHIENKPRNWSVKKWDEFYSLFEQSDKYFAFIIGDKVGSPNGLSNVVHTSTIFSDSQFSKSEVTLAALKVAAVTVGQQSSLPILSQYVGTPTLMFGHRKYRNMNFDNPLGVQKMFIENHNYDIDPIELFNQLKLFIRRIRK